jgi:hypothetical protein
MSISICHDATNRFATQDPQVMRELHNKIARLEIRAEQVLIHIRALPRRSHEATSARRELLDMLQLLRTYKEQRERLEDSTDLETAA